MKKSTGSGKVAVACAAFVLLIFVILSFANYSSFRIENDEGTARITRGRFMPWGVNDAIPVGGEAAFHPIPWTDPPTGGTDRGSLRKVTDTFYAMLYIAAGEAQDDPRQFDHYNMQASALEAWFADRWDATPTALEQMSEMRSRVNERRRATREYREKREQVLQLMQEMVDTLPARAPAALAADADMFRSLLERAQAAEL